MTSKRYTEKILDEYNLVRLVVPHYDDIRKIVGDQVREQCAKLKQSKISTLELGSGSGYTTEIVLSSDLRIKVIAVDNGPVIISQARVNLEDYVQTGRVELVEEDALTYLKSLEPESVDICVSTFVIHNFNVNYRNKLLKTLYGVLKDGGLFVNGDKYASDNETEHELDLKSRLQRFREVFDGIGRPDLKEEWVSHCLADNDPPVLMKEGESIGEMREIGFKEVEKIYRRYQEAIVVASK